MTGDFKAGYTQAYTEIKEYATSIVTTAPDPLPWLDMALYAQTSMEDAEDDLTLFDLDEDIQTPHE